MINIIEKNYGYYFGNKTLFLEFKNAIHSDTVINTVNEIKEEYPNAEIKIVAYKNILGYWAAYEIETGNSIYCGTMSAKTTKEQINKYLEEHDNI